MYDLEDRLLQFAIAVRGFIKQLPGTISICEDARQLIRSSGSIGANYIEANEALGKKDFVMRLRISRKEARETIYWLKIFLNTAPMKSEQNQACLNLIREATEITKILSAIIKKSL